MAAAPPRSICWITEAYSVRKTNDRDLVIAVICCILGFTIAAYRLLACSTTLRIASAASSGRALKPPSASLRPST